MNFLEQLAAEWYSYQGYFVRTNVKYGLKPKGSTGGFVGEMDVIAYHPKLRRVVHIETSTDSDSWDERRRSFTDKFERAAKYYPEVFAFPHGVVVKRAIVGLNWTHPPQFSVKGVEILSLRQFVKEIADGLREHTPLEKMVPQEWPLLRGIHMAIFWGKEVERNGR